MARGDGIHRTTARNARMTADKVGNAQAHNERQKGSYVNQDIVLERTPLNVHFNWQGDTAVTYFVAYREVPLLKAVHVIHEKSYSDKLFLGAS